MSWVAIARKDFHDAVRARSLWALSALFVIFAGGAAYLYGNSSLFGAGGQEVADALGLIGLLSGASSTLVPIIALLVGYKSLVGERESGSLKLLLSLPHRRLDAVVGKLAGRTLVVAVPILIGYLVAAVLGLATYGSFAIGDFLLFTLLTVALGLVYVSVAVGISGASAIVSRASAVAVGFWLVFEFLWGVLVLLLYYVVNGFSLSGLSEGIPTWMGFLSQLSPTQAYGVVVQALLPGSPSATIGVTVGGTAAAENPIYLEPWFGLLVMVAWIVGSVGFGYWRFDAADL